MTYSFFVFFGQGFCPRITVDALRSFPSNLLYGGRNRLQVAVWLSLDVVGYRTRYRSEHGSARIVLGIPTCH
jgi:hypothetical protein